MRNILKFLFIAVWLCGGLSIQSCDDNNAELEEQHVQFTLTLASSSGGDGDINVPENAMARISIANIHGSNFTDYEIPLFKSGEVYITEPIRLVPGEYTISDFMIVQDSIGLYVTPKKGAEITISKALPHNFSITETAAETLNMDVMDVRNQDLQKFGYGSSKAKPNVLLIAVYDRVGGDLSLTNATAEIHQNKKLIKRLMLTAGVNTINLGGDHKSPYTLTAYTANSAKSETFSIKTLKQQIGKDAFEIVLEPALVLAIRSYVDVGNEYEEYFEFKMDGVGSVNVNWGDGEQSAASLPFQISHEYFTGEYTLIVTGNIQEVTDFLGFSYGTIISAITGLTNLHALKIYDPSWGAVPIKVDLSNCRQLERINIAKYGAPYEPIDLRTDFKLPTEHFISAFIFDAPSFDSNREYISAEELEVMFDNIYRNAITRSIYNGTFLVNPVVTPSPVTQQKIDVLQNEYGWHVAFNDDIWGIYSLPLVRSSSGSDSNVRREQWLRDRFPNGEHIIARAEVGAVF